MGENDQAHKVQQTDFSAGSGNALQAAVATVFGVQLEDCPNFVQAQEGYEAAMQSWLAARGWKMKKLPLEDGFLRKSSGATPGDKCIVRGTSPRGDFGHVVVGSIKVSDDANSETFGVDFLHDPHPDGSMLRPPLVWVALFEPSLTLIGHAAFRSFRNVWMLEELGVAYKHIEAKPRTAEASAANPFGKIPSLMDGDFTMYESAAINTYLGDKFRARLGAPDLVPIAGTTERGRYEQFICCLMAEMDAQGLWIHRKHESLPQMLPQIFQAIPEAVTVARSHFDKVLGIMLDDLRRSGDYLLGETFSAADILFVHCLNWAEAIGWLPAPECGDYAPLLHEYLRRCRDRDAYKRAAAKK